MKKPLNGLIRLYVIISFFLISTLLLVWRAAYLSTGDPYALKKKQTSLVQKTVTLKAPKGEFFDRHHYPLAMNVPRYRVFIDFQRAELSAEHKKILLQYVARHSPAHRALLEGGAKKYLFAGVVGHDVQLELQRARVPGVYYEELTARYYPLGAALAQVIGRVDGEGRGVEGLEKLYDKQLDGKDSTQQLRQDRLGHTLDVASVQSSMRAGQSIVLTIDHRIQQYAYKELLQQLEVSEARSGAVVVLNQKGDIVAMVSAPSYNPNQPIDSIDDRMKNRAVVDIFEPGSTIKPIAFVGLLPSLKTDMLVDTQGGVYRLGRFSIRDVRHYGKLTLPEVMSKSSNVAMIKLSQQVPGDVLLQTYKKFKLFEPSYPGLLGEQITWRGMHIKAHTIPYYVLSYGYGMEVSILQLAHAYTILANRGEDYGVHIISSTQLSRSPPERVAAEDIVERTVKMMVKVVDEGTGKEALIPDVVVAGKTGTTHRITAGKYDKDKHIASFVGFAPADRHPDTTVYTIAVMLFEPKVGSHFGGQAAAPLFAKVMKYALSLEEFVDVPVY